jgi:geranylgeranyl diphosphate synthase type I
MGDASPQIIPLLNDLGENLGIMFQLKDDELGMFGEQKDLGKPVGDDIMTGKKTPYHYYLQQHATLSQQKKLAAIFGNSSSSEEDIRYVQTLCRNYKIDIRIQEILNNYATKAQDNIAQLQLNEQSKFIFQDLLNFNLTRKK